MPWRFGIAACAALSAPAARAADPGADPWTLFAAACAGAVIAVLAALAVQRLINRREVGELKRTLAASADWWWRTGADLKASAVGTGQRDQPLDAQRLLGRIPWDLGDGAAPPATLAQAIAARAPFFDQLLQVRIGGAERTFAVSGTPLFSPAAQFEGYVGVTRDVSDTLAGALAPNREQAELIARLRAENDERSRQFELAVKDLDSFAHSVSHDLRAPLRVIDGFANIVIEDYGKRLDDLGREHVKRIVAAGNRMNSMIDTLLAMARTTSRTMARERVDLSELAREQLDELLSQREAEGPRNVEYVIADDLVVDGDRTALRLVLQNLLSNAYKFTGRQPVARIEVGMTDAQGRRAYFVRDNGAGFDMRFADKLFGVFQRFHSQSEFPGTGVGLATVQQIVRKHGGRIWAQSEPGKGAAFYFTLWE